MEGIRYGNEPLDDAQNAVFIGVYGSAAAEHHLDAGEDKDGAEDEDHPLKMEERRAQRDEDGAEDQCPEDAVEEHAVLELLGNAEEAEDDDKDEHVVDAERFFENVSGEKFERDLAGGVRGYCERVTVEPVAEQQGHRHPHEDPRPGFDEGDDVGLAMEQAEIDDEQQ